LEGLYLIKKGANPKVKSSNGSTPLHLVVSGVQKYQGNPKDGVKIIKHLIHKGADVNAQNDRGETALHIAVQECYEEAVKTLLKAKNINQSLVAVARTFCHHKVTPGHLAIFGGRPDILELLIKNNVNKIFIEDGEGHTVPKILEDMKHVCQGMISVNDLKLRYGDSFLYVVNNMSSKEKMEHFIKIFDKYFL